MMTQKINPRKFTRRDFLKWGMRGALFTALAGGALAQSGRQNRLYAAPAGPVALPQTGPALRPAGQTGVSQLRLAATDGFVSLPGRRINAPYGHPDFPGNGVYVFGFIAASTSDTIAQVINDHKGRVQMPSPTIIVGENVDLYMTLTNLGLETRPDLDDAHTIHWHGFRNPNSVFDGVPEVSISVPVARNFPYFYRTRPDSTGAGTYMYHCHFEDTEHVQMGMDGIVFVRPTQGRNFAYNDLGSGVDTSFDREYTLLFNEIDTTPHDNLAQVQEFVWSDFKPNYFVINGRSYPDTLYTDQDLAQAAEGDGTIPGDLKKRQPISSLIQALPGERILLRMASLGYEQHVMQLEGIRMTVVGLDANFLGDLAYNTHNIYIGPGEARDAIFTAPAFDPNRPVETDAAGNYNVYWFRARDYHTLVNDRLPGLGGMVTQVRVYDPANHHPDLDTPQSHPNQTCPKVVA